MNRANAFWEVHVIGPEPFPSYPNETSSSNSKADAVRADFLDEVVRATPDGEKLRGCIQCGTCGGSCPNGSEMDRSPRALFALIAAGDREEVFNANTMWVCVSCYLCTVRCPKEIPITDLMYTLKRMAAPYDAPASRDALALAQSFHHFIERYGRSFELGIASRYYLRRRPGALLGMGPLGFRMLTRGRLHLKPKRIEHIEELQKILEAAEQIGAEP